jgi:hypothetical protein
MSDFEPERIFAQLNSAGDAWADAQAAAELLEESKKSVLAELMVAQTEGTQSAKEANALASPVYKLHLTNMVSARKEANRARVRFDSMKVLAELRRTQAANRRAEINLR